MMKANVNQAALKAGKPSQSRDELVFQIAAQVAERLKPLVAGQPERGEASEALRGEEAKLTERLTWLEREVQALKDYLREQNSQAQSSQAGEVKQSKKPVSQAVKPGYTQNQDAKPAEQQAGGCQATEPDEQTAERWAREHLAEWLDAPCTFVKAQGRTWRQLAENKGDKITINGKASPPRAYLHTLILYSLVIPLTRKYRLVSGRLFEREKAFP